MRALCLCLLLGGCSSPDPILGTWAGTGSLGTPLSMQFEKGGHLSVRIDGSSRTGEWAVDRQHTPIHLDLDLTDRDPIQTIVAFPSSDILRYADIHSSDARPTAFADTTVELRRKP